MGAMHEDDRKIVKKVQIAAFLDQLGGQVAVRGQNERKPAAERSGQQVGCDHGAGGQREMGIFGGKGGNKVDRVIVMYCGETMEEATVSDLFREPSHPYTVGLLSTLPRFGQGGNGYGERAVFTGSR